MLDRFKSFWQGVMLAPFVRLFLHLGISPDAVTIVGTLGVAAGALIFFPQGELLIGVLVITAFVFSDLIDGAMARASGRSSPFGAFLDSTLDRYSEGAMYIGLAAYFATMSGPLQRWLLLATVAALAGSFLVSYVRARAQSLGFTCDSGLFARPERVVVTVVGLIFGGVVLYGVVFLLAILTNLTALQRIREVWLQGRAQRIAMEREKAAAPKAGNTVTP